MFNLFFSKCLFYLTLSARDEYPFRGSRMDSRGEVWSALPLKKVKREAAAQRARPKVSEKPRFFRETTGRMV